MKREVEILFELKENADSAMKKLKNLKPVCIKRKIVDTYYFDPLRDALKPSDLGGLSSCFRLRQKGHQVLMTYKVDHFNGDAWLYSDEFETEVSSLDTAKQIFAKLGLEVLVVVNGTRSIFTSDKFEVVVEAIEGLGSFIEVEYHYSDDIEDVPAAKQHIREWLSDNNIRLGEEMNAGKPELLLRLQS